MNADSSLHTMDYSNGSRTVLSNFPIGPLKKPKAVVGAPVSTSRFHSNAPKTDVSYESTIGDDVSSVTKRGMFTPLNDNRDRDVNVNLSTTHAKSKISTDNAKQAENKQNNLQTAKKQTWSANNENYESESCDVFDTSVKENAADESTNSELSSKIQPHSQQNNAFDESDVFHDDSNSDRPLSPWSRDMLNYNRSLLKLDLDLEELRSKIRSLSTESRKQFLQTNRHILLNTNDPELMAAAAEGEPDDNEDADTLSPGYLQKDRTVFKSFSQNEQQRFPSNDYSGHLATKKFESNFLPTSYGTQPFKPQGLVGPYLTSRNLLASQNTQPRSTFVSRGDTVQRSLNGQNLLGNKFGNSKVLPAYQRTFSEEAREGEPDTGDEQLNESIQSNFSGSGTISTQDFRHSTSLLNFHDSVNNNILRPVALRVPVQIPTYNNSVANRPTLEYVNNDQSAGVNNSRRLSEGFYSPQAAKHASQQEFKVHQREAKVIGPIIVGGQPKFATSSNTVTGKNRPEQSKYAALGESMPDLSMENFSSTPRTGKVGSQSFVLGASSKAHEPEPTSNASFAITFDGSVERRGTRDKARASRPLSQPVTVTHAIGLNNSRASMLGGSHEETTGSRGGVRSSHKSNRHIIVNALSFSCLAGPANERVKMDVLEEIARSTANNFIVLFRDTKLQFRSLYTYNSDSEELVKLYGIGPKQINNNMIEKFYKYDSGAKEFIEIKTTKHVGVTVDGITLQGHYWKSRPATQQQQRR